ncbi:hypothetical protein CGLO_13627 [Colletotrichum gloeosporioides Cg-14]|uniref:Uncharacterized protein n=1 Tax=Colletotrichum gloeosporioides (strain Cg-14) TaxID=1237896 RepID=T0K5R4_COLGC|nr:hypothetical protein CGLO_13627 [Colletotrichum gloeosporioides Cg-14]
MLIRSDFTSRSELALLAE